MLKSKQTYSVTFRWDMTAYNDERAVLLAKQIADYQNSKFNNNASVVSISTEDNLGTRIIDLKKYEYLTEENKEK